MKKVKQFIFITLFAFLSCNDGDVIEQEINFDDVTAAKCTDNDIVYKINDAEALLVELPDGTFTTEPNDILTPTQISIGTTSNRVVYRFYNGTVGVDNICETIQPATPSIKQEWQATSGTISIVTTPVKTTNTTENSTRITGYNHNIVFKNITFDTGSGSQVYETLTFGDYVISTSALSVSFDKVLDICSATNTVYDFNTSEALMLDIDPALIENEVTASGNPRTGLIGITTNKLTYRLFSELLTDSYFCVSPTPSAPALEEEWAGIEGESGVSGIIEVTTTSNGPNSFLHTITLKKVTLFKGNNSFLLGDSYDFGELITN
jgi:hypothetical protein